MSTPDSRVEYATRPVAHLAVSLESLLNHMADDGWRYVGTADGEHIFERPRTAH